MRLHYFSAIGWCHVRVPDRLRIDDYHGTVAALIEATGFVDANLTLQSTFRYFFAQHIADLDSTLLGTGLSTYANKHVFLEYFHCSVVLYTNFFQTEGGFKR